jgi:hypothetical protein
MLTYQKKFPVHALSDVKWNDISLLKLIVFFMTYVITLNCKSEMGSEQYFV